MQNMTIFVGIGVAILCTLVFAFAAYRKGYKKAIARSTRSTLEVKQVRQMDLHKRKSLQPSNAVKVPDDLPLEPKKPVAPKPLQPSNVRVTPKLEGEFSHKFFGSQLIVNDRVLAGSLPRKMHLLEITASDQVFIDGMPQQFHVGDVEELKKTIRGHDLIRQ